MKTLLNNLLKGRITRWGFLAVVLLAAGATVAGINQRQHQLGGGFLGNNGGGNIWSAFQIPLDPAGRTAAVRVNLATYGPDFAGLLANFGGDTVTEFTGEIAMINRDTAKYNTIAYGLKQGNPPQVCMILVMRGTLKFTGPDNFVVTYDIDVYPGPANALGLQNADADLDGFPDAGVKPVATIPGVDAAKRVPLP
jgi:hypothetical protein